MKKFLRRLIGGALALVCIVIAGLFLLSSLAPDFIASGLSKNLRVPVTIGDISFSLNTITVNNLDIANIPKSRLSKALSVKKINSRCYLLNYLKETINIEQITLDDIYLGLEFDTPKSAQGNWTVLMSNLESATASTSKEESKTVIIKELILTNIQVDVVYKSGGSIKKLKPIPRIVLRDINSSQGFPADQIMKSVLGQMLKSVFIEENLKNMFEDLLTNPPKNATDAILQPFKNLFGT